MLTLIIGLILLFSVYRGWKKGLILGLTDLFAWAGTLLLSVVLFQAISLFLEYYRIERLWSVVVSLLLTIILVRIIIQYLIDLVLNVLPPAIHRDKLNRLLGMLTGFVTGIIYSGLLLLFLLILPFPERYTSDFRNSQLGAALIGKVQQLQGKLVPVLPDAMVTIEPEDRGSVKLSYSVKNAVRRPDLEAAMLVLVNEERAKAGLKQLKADPEIAEVAVKHSVDMFSRSYFSHYTPEGKDPFWRMKQGHIRFLAAGENLALAPTLEVAHNGLMNSPGHRANILHKSFGRLGIGIVDGGVRGLMVTQNFRN